MKLYVVRHGQTDWNADNKVCGRTDIDLNQEGFNQAVRLATYFYEEHIELDMIFSSPLNRALKTAQKIGVTNSVKVIMDNRLIEQNYGVFEGADRGNTEFLKNKSNFAFRYPGGESMMQVAHRVYSFLDEIKERYENKKILIVSHGGVCRILHSYF